MAIFEVPEKEKTNKKAAGAYAFCCIFEVLTYHLFAWHSSTKGVKPPELYTWENEANRTPLDKK